MTALLPALVALPGTSEGQVTAAGETVTVMDVCAATVPHAKASVKTNITNFKRFIAGDVSTGLLEFSAEGLKPK